MRDFKRTFLVIKMENVAYRTTRTFIDSSFIIGTIVKKILSLNTFIIFEEIRVIAENTDVLFVLMMDLAIRDNGWVFLASSIIIK